MPSQAQKRVLDISRSMFARQGTCVSMRDIARELGIRAPSIYSHFPSKGALLRDCLADYTEAVASWSNAHWENAWDAALGYMGIVAVMPESVVIVHQDPSTQNLPLVQDIDAAIHATFARQAVPLVMIKSLAAAIRAPYLDLGGLSTEATGDFRNGLYGMITAIAPAVVV